MSKRPLPHTGELLNKRELAELMKRSRGYITSMIAGGYRMRYGTRTTLEHALTWLEENPDFRSTEFFKRRTAPITQGK